MKPEGEGDILIFRPYEDEIYDAAKKAYSRARANGGADAILYLKLIASMTLEDLIVAYNRIVELSPTADGVKPIEQKGNP